MSRVYNSNLRRRREGKTNYRKRKALVMSKKTFVSVRTFNKNILVQVSTCSPEGDKVIASAHSRELKKFGWLGSGKNICAAYLTALLAGIKAAKKGAKEAILYPGLKGYISGSRVSASVSGALDAGLSIPVDPETLAQKERLAGVHIAEYAKELSKEKLAYKARFSSLLKNGLSPEDYPKHFDSVKAKILSLGGPKSE